MVDAPTHIVEVAFGSDPFATPTWTDISRYVKSFSFDRGVQFELDQTQTGKVSLTLDNRNRRFDPTYTGSPHYPYVRPMTRIRIRATWNAATYGLFSGFVQSWPQSYPDGGASAIVDVDGSDSFLMLSLARVSATYSQELSGTRVNNILTAVGWPSADKSVDAGQSTVAAVTLADESALSHLQDVATAELGLLFVDKAGILQFVDRHQFILNTLDPTLYTWGDVESEHRYSDIVAPYDETHLWNQVHITPNSGNVQSVEDTTSKGRYGPRTLPRTVILASDNEALDQANFLLARFKDPEIRVQSIDLAVVANPAQWPYVLDHDIGDRLRVIRRPEFGGDPIEQDVYIAGIAMSADGETGVWTVTWRLAPQTGTVDYWVLDESALDDTTRLAY